MGGTWASSKLNYLFSELIPLNCLDIPLTLVIYIDLESPIKQLPRGDPILPSQGFFLLLKQS